MLLTDRITRLTPERAEFERRHYTAERDLNWVKLMPAVQLLQLVTLSRVTGSMDILCLKYLVKLF